MWYAHYPVSPNGNSRQNYLRVLWHWNNSSFLLLNLDSSFYLHSSTCTQFCIILTHIKIDWSSTMVSHKLRALNDQHVFSPSWEGFLRSPWTSWQWIWWRWWWTASRFVDGPFWWTLLRRGREGYGERENEGPIRSSLLWFLLGIKSS